MNLVAHCLASLAKSVSPKSQWKTLVGKLWERVPKADSWPTHTCA